MSDSALLLNVIERTAWNNRGLDSDILESGACYVTHASLPGADYERVTKHL